MKIRLSGYIIESIVDGPGIRFVVFTQGCLHNCPGCHNPNTHPLNKGRLIEISEIIDIVKTNPLIQGLTISGGEPLLQPTETLELIKMYQEVFPKHNILLYTGFTYEELLKQNNPLILEILQNLDLLIDGRYLEKFRDLTLFYRGSSNQRIIDVKESLKTNKIILSKYQDMLS